jgi:glutaredoxin
MFSSRRAAFSTALSILALFALFVSPAAADWLVLLDGTLIETQDAWTIAGERLTYTDLEGKAQTLLVDQIDLEGSAETTAMKQGLPYEPPPPVAPPPVNEPAARKFPALNTPGRPPVILYATSWCGYCRKARALLKDLKVDFIEKNIERDRAAANEMAKKAGSRSGVPVLDIGGYIVRGYSDRQIRQLVKDLNKAMAKKAETAVSIETS